MNQNNCSFFSKMHPDNLKIDYRDVSTSFPQNSFLPEKPVGKNVIFPLHYPSQATDNLSSSTIRSDESLKIVRTNKNVNYTTIDEKHTKIVNNFYHLENTELPKLLEEKQNLIEKLHSLKKNSTQIEKILDIQDKLIEIKKNIKKIKTEKKKYYLDNSKYIFQYFEEKKNISTGGNIQNISKLNNFFKIKTNIHPTIEEPPPPTSKNIYHKYWKNVNNEILNVQDYVISTDICMFCKNGEMIQQDEEGVMVCNNKLCGKFIPYIIDSCKPSNKEPPIEVSYTAYVRLNHFKEILSQFQAKETTQIPEDVIELIRKRIKKERININELNYDKMREILRKLGLNKYFEHIQYINSIFGIKPPIMNEELYETLCVLFIEIQKPWSYFCPANRTNFFNYTYPLFQLCVLLDQTQYLPYIPLLKDRDKQIEADLIWKKICNYLDWVYYPTV